jgi:hypothetical protein
LRQRNASLEPGNVPPTIALFLGGEPTWQFLRLRDV